MKKLSVIILVALAAVSCGQKFNVVGKVSEQMASMGDKLVIGDQSFSDTVTIVEGQFTYTGKADPTKMLAVKYPAPEGGRARTVAQFIPEAGTIIINVDGPATTVSGTPANDNYKAYSDKLREISDELSAQLPVLTADVSEERAEAVYDSLSNILYDYMKQVAAENSGNAVSTVIISNLIYNCETLAEAEELLKDCQPFVRENSTVSKVLSNLEAAETTREGSMFVDFEGESMAGEPLKLSDFVGKGNYVLLDFWASWCGPCRAEVPVIKEVYEKYSDAGLVCLGVAVWDKKNDTSKAIADLQLPWNQIFDVNEIATNLYGVNGIPHIILFAPDGTIAARNLRGENLKATVAKAMEEVF